MTAEASCAWQWQCLLQCGTGTLLDLVLRLGGCDCAAAAARSVLHYGTIYYTLLPPCNSFHYEISLVECVTYPYPSQVTSNRRRPTYCQLRKNRANLQVLPFSIETLPSSVSP